MEVIEKTGEARNNFPKYVFELDPDATEIETYKQRIRKKLEFLSDMKSMEVVLPGFSSMVRTQKLGIDNLEKRWKWGVLTQAR